LLSLVFGTGATSPWHFSHVAGHAVLRSCAKNLVSHELQGIAKASILMTRFGRISGCLSTTLLCLLFMVAGLVLLLYYKLLIAVGNHFIVWSCRGPKLCIGFRREYTESWPLDRYACTTQAPFINLCRLGVVLDVIRFLSWQPWSVGHILGNLLQKRFNSYWLICVVLLTILVQRPANAQTASVSGGVVDGSGAAIAGASVTLSSTGNVREEMLTDSLGMFKMQNILPGRYRVTIEKDRFETAQAEIEIVRDIPIPPIHIVLQVGMVHQSINVEARSSYIADNASVATKIDTPLMETPFTAQVMPQQVLIDMAQQQNMGEAMRYLGVATAGFDSYVNSYFYRGFNSTGTLWNGFKLEELTTTAGPGVGPTWMDTVDHVELMRGPSSVLYGQIEPGGIVDILTKKPLDDLHGEIRTGVGSWTDRWGSVTLTGPLNKSRALSGSAIAAGQWAPSWYTYSPEYRSQGISPELQWRIRKLTTLSFEGQYRNVQAETWQYSYSYADPVTGQLVSAPLKDSRWPDNVGRWEQRRAMLGLDQRVGENWSASWKFLYDRPKEPYAQYQFTNSADFSTQAPGVLFASFGLIYNGTALRTRASTLDVVGHFSTGGLKHTLLVGGDIYSQNFRATSGCCGPDDLTTNIFHPLSAILGPGGDLTVTDRLRIGIYVQDQIALTGKWFLLAGLRYDRIREDYAYNGVPFPSYDKNVATPRVGLLWHPIEPFSVYYSYSRNQGQSQGFEYPGTPLKPESAEQHEAGIKTSCLNSRLSASASVFQLVKQNIASADPNPAHVTFVIGLGQVRSRGFELSVQGSPAAHWRLLSNYSYARPIITVGASGANIGGNSAFSGEAGQLLPGLPKQIFSAWSSYDVPRLRGFSLGGGASWRSKAVPYSSSFNLVTGEIVSADAYWLASAFARYETRIEGLKTEFQLNVDNLLDNLYSNYTGCDGGYGSNDCYHTYGNPRSAQLQMRLTF
jgi:iron complex outermembrane recepter protein